MEKIVSPISFPPPAVLALRISIRADVLAPAFHVAKANSYNPVVVGAIGEPMVDPFTEKISCAEDWGNQDEI